MFRDDRLQVYLLSHRMLGLVALACARSQMENNAGNAGTADGDR
jgi:hypothetical protein